MKTLVAVAMILSFCSSAAGECVIPRALVSFRDTRITVLRDEKPQEAVKLTVTLPNGQRRSFVTDSRGQVILTDLPEGTNCVTAVGEDAFEAHLCLMVSKDVDAKISAFVLTLASTLPPPPAIGSALPDVVKQLDIVVQDQSGGIIPHAEVRVYARESYPKNPLLKAWTDQDGRFLAAPLNPGTYAVAVRSGGFRAAVRVIRISPEGRIGPVQEVLQVGSC